MRYLLTFPRMKFWSVLMLRKRKHTHTRGRVFSRLVGDVINFICLNRPSVTNNTRDTGDKSEDSPKALSYISFFTSATSLGRISRKNGDNFAQGRIYVVLKIDFLMDFVISSGEFFSGMTTMLHNTGVLYFHGENVIKWLGRKALNEIYVVDGNWYY